ncbi:MAG: hypothetical protein ACRDRU_15025 [Pseudonocardiaceae bacterium]
MIFPIWLLFASIFDAPHLADLAAAAGEIGRLRHALRQVITLADDAPTITDQQLRDRLLALAFHAR